MKWSCQGSASTKKMGLFWWSSRDSASTTCCMMRTSKQPYPDDDIELVHLERASFSVKEHESLMGITTPTTG